MTEIEVKMMEILGLAPEDFKPNDFSIAEEAYLIAEYNSILLEILMEE